MYSIARVFLPRNQRKFFVDAAIAGRQVSLMNDTDFHEETESPESFPLKNSSVLLLKSSVNSMLKVSSNKW